MNRSLRHRVTMRDVGRQRVSSVTALTAMGGTALTALFGIAFANTSTAAATSHATQQLPTGSGTQPRHHDDDGGGTFTVQPPAQAPQGAFSGGTGGGTNQVPQQQVPQPQLPPAVGGGS